MKSEKRWRLLNALHRAAFAVAVLFAISSSVALAADEYVFLPSGYNPENVSYSGESAGIPLESATKVVTSSSTELESFWRVSDESEGIPIRTDKLRMFYIIFR